MSVNKNPGNTNVFGILYIVATPIGNLGDITVRALDTLREVDLIAAEDTRHSGKLLQHFGITKPLFALHDFNEKEKSQQLINKLLLGQNVALISDAGTPLISDPGYRLVHEVRNTGMQVIPIPGACAAITALCASGLPTDKFVFAGFLPAKTIARKNCLQELISETRTLIFYESPHRLLDTCADILQVFGDTRQAVLAKELTKTFEAIYNGTLIEIIDWLEADPARQKGEFVILIHGAEKTTTELDSEAIKVLTILCEELPVKQAAALAAKITGISKNTLYQAALGNKHADDKS